MDTTDPTQQIDVSGSQGTQQPQVQPESTQNIPTSDMNPGDLKDPNTGEFLKFSSPLEGQAALYNDLSYKMSDAPGKKLNGQSSLLDFAKTYAPASDDNDPLNYAAKLANQLGVSPDAPIGSLSGNIDGFAKAIANNEGYDGPWAGGNQPSNTAPPSTNPPTSGGSNPPSTGVPPTTPPPTSGGMPTWEKWVLGGALGVGGAIGAYFTGGADVPEVIAGETALEGGVEAAGAEAASTASSAADNPSLLSKGINLAKGAAIGNTVDNTIKGVLGGGSSKSTPPAGQTPVSTDSSDTLDDSTLPASQDATNQISQAQNEALSQFQTGRQYASTPDAQSGIQANAMYGIVPEIENGFYNSKGAITQSQGMVGELAENVAKTLDAEGGTANINEATDNAISNMKKYTPSHEWEDAEGHIREQAESYKKFADPSGNISLGNMQRMKTEQGKAAGKWDMTTSSAKRSAHKALSMGARKSITDHTKNKDLYEKAMKEEQRLIQGQKVLKKLDGKKATKKTTLLRHGLDKLATYAALAIGDKIGGPFGAIVGSIVGDTITKVADRHYGKSMFDSSSMKKAIELMAGKKPAVANLLKNKIKEYSSIIKPIEKEVEMNLPKIEEKEEPKYKMGTYKLKKNEHSGLYKIGNYRPPESNFYTKKGRPSDKAKESRKHKGLLKLKK